MEQKEFIELSKEEVKSLNGLEEKEGTTESWRGGYIYAMKEISNILNNSGLHLDDFMEKLENFVNQNIDEIDDDADFTPNPYLLSGDEIDRAVQQRISLGR